MSQEVVLSLTKIRTEVGTSTLEQHIADALFLPRSKVTALIDEGLATLIIYLPERDDVSSDDYDDADDIATKLNDVIQRGEADKWTTDRGATCVIADDEDSVSIDEEDALIMWREMSEEMRTGHLEKVPNPDGLMIQPSHETTKHSEFFFPSPTESHLKRDPTLFDFDNVTRVDASQIKNISWEEPVIITNVIPDDFFANRGILDKRRLASIHGEIEVRTGNRETLIDNGITNSRPMPLSEALSTTPPVNNSVETENSGSYRGRIVFSPVKELPDKFANDLKQFTDCFPRCSAVAEEEEETSMTKFTLTLASGGFGIGMHKHKAAMFMLLVGRKKWYMASSDDLEGDDQTHPGFYREKSSHKCIQEEGEVLFVPNEWYHEIFNLEYTAGIQALPVS